MKRKVLEMPEVNLCNVTECAYNSKNMCHARAITIGDAKGPMCDTFFKNDTHCKHGEAAGVGACKISACIHNAEFECMADNIRVEKSGNKIMCMTFKGR